MTHQFITFVVALWVCFQEGRTLFKHKVLQDGVHAELFFKGNIVHPHGGGLLQVIAAGPKESAQQGTPPTTHTLVLPPDFFAFQDPAKLLHVRLLCMSGGQQKMMGGHC
eukprot:880648-Pelagomonas_calceolata.AAC.3